MKIIVLDGVEYELVPVKKDIKEVKEEKSILDDYKGVQEAKPEIYDWKKELDAKRRRNMSNSILKKIPRQDRELDQFGDLIVGEGTRQVF